MFRQRGHTSPEHDGARGNLKESGEVTDRYNLLTPVCDSLHGDSAELEVNASLNASLKEGGKSCLSTGLSTSSAQLHSQRRPETVDDYIDNHSDFFDAEFARGYQIRLQSAVNKWCQANGRANAIKQSGKMSEIHQLVAKYLVDETALITLSVHAGFDDILYPAKPNAVVDYVCQREFPLLDGTKKRCVYRHMVLRDVHVEQSDISGQKMIKPGKQMKGIKNLHLDFERNPESYLVFNNRKVMLPISFGDTKFQLPKDYASFQKTTLFAVLEYLRQFQFTSFDVVLFATSQAATCQIYNMLRKGGADIPRDAYTEGLSIGATDAEVEAHLITKARDWIEAFIPYLKRSHRTPDAYIPLEEAIGCEVKIYGVDHLIETMKPVYRMLRGLYNKLGSALDDPSSTRGIRLDEEARTASSISPPSSPARGNASDGDNSLVPGQPVAELSILSTSIGCLFSSDSEISASEDCRKLVNLLEACGYSQPWQYRKVMADYNDLNKVKPTDFALLEDSFVMVKYSGAVYMLLDLVSVKSIPTQNRPAHEAWYLKTKGRFLSELCQLSSMLMKRLSDDASILQFKTFIADNLTKFREILPLEHISLEALPYLAVLDFAARHNMLSNLSTLVSDREKAQEIFSLSIAVNQSLLNFPRETIQFPPSPRALPGRT